MPTTDPPHPNPLPPGERGLCNRPLPGEAGHLTSSGRYVKVAVSRPAGAFLDSTSSNPFRPVLREKAAGFCQRPGPGVHPVTGSRQRLAQRLPFFYGWVILASASSTQVVRNASASLTLAVFIYPLAADPELGWSRTLVAGAASVGGLAASALSPLVGWLIDRYGARLVLASSVFIMGLATISLAWATIPIFFYLFYGISRVIFASPIPIGASVVVSRWFVRMRGRTNGILFASHSIGLVAFPLIASAVIASPGLAYGVDCVGRPGLDYCPDSRNLPDCAAAGRPGAAARRRPGAGTRGGGWPERRRKRPVAPTGRGTGLDPEGSH